MTSAPNSNSLAPTAPEPSDNAVPNAAPKRVFVVVNKWWECDPLMAVLLHDKARPKDVLGWPQLPGHPRPRPSRVSAPLPAPTATPTPRAVFALPHTNVEVWCVSDLMEHLPEAPAYQSSSEQKARALPRLYAAGKPDFLVAVGTAGFAGTAHVNGSVVVGAKVYMHDCHPNGENPESAWSDPQLGRLLPPTVDADQFRRLTGIAEAVEPRLLPTPINPAPERLLLASRNYVAVGAVNVTNYDEYAWADHAAIRAHAAVDAIGEAASLETTHGVIRAFAPETPFLFVSGITDTVGTFGLEVTPREYAQNVVAAHNAGVVVAWLLPKVDALLAPAKP